MFDIFTDRGSSPGSVSVQCPSRSMATLTFAAFQHVVDLSLQKELAALQVDGACARDLLKIQKPCAISANDICAHHTLIWHISDCYLDVAWCEKKTVDGHMHLLDVAKHHKLSNTHIVADQLSWAEVESSKLRAVWAYFLKLCIKH